MKRFLTNLVLAFVGLSIPLGVVWFSGVASAWPPGPGATRHYEPLRADGARMMSESSTSAKDRVFSRSGYDITPLTDAEKVPLIAKLTPEQIRITQKSGTEAAFCGNLLDNKKDGVYCCVVCGLPLFDSDDKFDSGTGWPSFSTTYDPKHVTGKEDRAYGMVRIEINCARCGSHLGHVFEDGPAPSRLRFCLNSESLVFHERGTELPPESRPIATEVAYFAGGCFWGVEHYFQKGDGVIDVSSGYMQGHVDDPTYEDVLTKKSGHAEAVKVVYDPTRISYRRLLEAFFVMHDPTTLNRQGPDVGPQYRSGVYAANQEQLDEAKRYVAELTLANAFRNPITTEVELAAEYFEAEDFHQDYIERTGRACSLKNPWPILAERDAREAAATGSESGSAG